MWGWFVVAQAATPGNEVLATTGGALAGKLVGSTVGLLIASNLVADRPQCDLVCSFDTIGAGAALGSAVGSGLGAITGSSLGDGDVRRVAIGQLATIGLTGAAVWGGDAALRDGQGVGAALMIGGVALGVLGPVPIAALSEGTGELTLSPKLDRGVQGVSLSGTF